MARPTPASDPAHDLPDQVRVIVEVPRGSRVKRAASGRIDYVSPLASPFNYGSVPDRDSADGEPLDALILGPSLRRGTTLDVGVHGVVRFVDLGLRDDKLVCGAAPPDGRDLRRIERFFWRYAHLKDAWARLRGRGRVIYEGYTPR